MTTLVTIHIPSPELHLLLDMAEPQVDYDNQPAMAALFDHWRGVANQVDCRSCARAREEGNTTCDECRRSVQPCARCECDDHQRCMDQQPINDGTGDWRCCCSLLPKHAAPSTAYALQVVNRG